MLGERTWTHSICWDCWRAKEGQRQPVRNTSRHWEMCCFCGATHDSGIYVREDQRLLKCAGTEKINAQSD